MISLTDSAQLNLAPAAPPCPTLWGLDPSQIHDRFWAARGVQVVRLGQPSQIVRHAELFLLTEPHSLTIFKIGWLVDHLSWLKPDMLLLRLHETRDHGYREMVITDNQNRFVRFSRLYSNSEGRTLRLALTADRRIAELWQSAPDPRAGWRLLRRRIARNRRAVVSVDGQVYDRTIPEEVMLCMRDLTQVWETPDATVERARHAGAGVWTDRDSKLDPALQFIGPAWVGAGRQSISEKSIVGPAVLWDDPLKRPAIKDLQWQEIEPSPVFTAARVQSTPSTSSFYLLTKRLFDIAFSLMVLMLLLPVYPIVMLAIWLEDGRPIFFAHRRETIGGREFPCIKFRSMRNNSEAIKAQLVAKNKADGPQFFIDPENDPRLTYTGKLLRKLNIDELPQFINVLMGDMSIVGPRPSPRSENQCCPPWREARLSVRPGITGLWQIMRTRQQGMDFQEWIKYDIEYVEKANWKLDLWVVWKTILLILKMSD